MDKRIRDIFVMNTKRENALWQDAIFVFDTSVIGDMYSLTASTRDTLIAILNHFQARCWVPAQVMYEYSKNLEKFINNPIKEKYGNPAFLKNVIVNEISNYLEKIKLQPYYHPYLDDGLIGKIEIHRDALTAELEGIKSIVKTQYDKRKKELLNVKSNDEIQKLFDGMTVGTPFSFSEVMAIAKEGDYRYGSSIPPGYEDVDRKVGTQKYGDLIIWKEILRYSKENKKPVIFICNDVKKGDIYIKDENGNPIGPRHELIREFVDETQQDFWMYTLSIFISKLEEHYKDTSTLPLFDGLENVKYALAYQALEKSDKTAMIVHCSHCKKMVKFKEDNFDYDWEACGWSERKMGQEIEYESNEYCYCPECGEPINFVFHAWEYPVGVVNYTEIESENATVIRPLCLQELIDVSNHDVCERCGEIGAVNEYGLCENCENEFRFNIERDD